MLQLIHAVKPSTVVVKDEIKGTPIPMQDGSQWQTVYLRSNFKEAYKDEYTNEIIPDHLITEAVRE